MTSKMAKSANQTSFAATDAGNTVQPASGFREPPVVCYRLRGSGVHLGNAR
jgi:hypothetical protein